MITVDAIWVDKCIVQVGHTSIAENFSGSYKNSNSPYNFSQLTCIIRLSLLSICNMWNLLNFVSEIVSISI